MQKRHFSLAIGAVVFASLSGCSFTPTRPAQPVNTGAALKAQGCDLLPDQDRSTIVILEPSTGRKLVCTEARSHQRFVPASTLKIPHSLIALETSAVTSKDAKFAWDERARGPEAWNKSLSLAEAIPASAVWVFQDIAEKVGHPRESEWVKKLEFGNQDVGSKAALKHFWLSGPLEISAQEQIDFLRRLRTGRLPVKPAIVAQTISALHVAQAQDGSTIYGKTGAMLPIDDEGFLRSDRTDLLPLGTERTGWFVGWIDRTESAGGLIYFALNIDLGLPDAMNARTKAAYAVLAANGFSTPKPSPQK